MLSYNSETPTANWVSSQLNRSWIGAADREDNLHPDNALPAEAYKVRPSDNTGSGYNRGHIAPSADRTRNEADNSSTFLMTNMMPQIPELNRGVWSDLEDYCRKMEKLSSFGKATETEDGAKFIVERTLTGSASH